MKTILVLLPVVIALAACGETSKIKDVIRQHLKDPGSAEFKDTVFSSDNKRACIVWNAKNSLGGYGDWDVAELWRENAEWRVRKMKGSELNCSETGFKALDAGLNAEFDARRKAVETLRKLRNISIEDAADLASNGECSKLVGRFAYVSSNAAEYRIRQDSGMLHLYEKELRELQTRLDKGDCNEALPVVEDNLGLKEPE